MSKGELRPYDLLTPKERQQREELRRELEAKHIVTRKRPELPADEGEKENGNGE